MGTRGNRARRVMVEAPACSTTSTGSHPIPLGFGNSVQAPTMRLEPKHRPAYYLDNVMSLFLVGVFSHLPFFVKRKHPKRYILRWRIRSSKSSNTSLFRNPKFSSGCSPVPKGMKVLRVRTMRAQSCFLACSPEICSVAQFFPSKASHLAFPLEKSFKRVVNITTIWAPKPPKPPKYPCVPPNFRRVPRRLLNLLSIATRFVFECARVYAINSINNPSSKVGPMQLILLADR